MGGESIIDTGVLFPDYVVHGDQTTLVSIDILIVLTTFFALRIFELAHMTFVAFDPKFNKNVNNCAIGRFVLPSVTYN